MPLNLSQVHAHRSFSLARESLTPFSLVHTTCIFWLVIHGLNCVLSLKDAADEAVWKLWFGHLWMQLPQGWRRSQHSGGWKDQTIWEKKKIGEWLKEKGVKEWKFRGREKGGSTMKDPTAPKGWVLCQRRLAHADFCGAVSDVWSLNQNLFIDVYLVYHVVLFQMYSKSDSLLYIYMYNTYINICVYTYI